MTNADTSVPAGEEVADPQSQTSQEQVAQATPAESEQKSEPQYVTVDQLSQFGKQLTERLKQSDRDRTKRIEGEIAGIRELVTKAGLQITPQQEAVLREEVGARIDNEAAPPSQAPAGQYSQPADTDPIVEFVSGAFQNVGTSVSRSDPEWAKIQKVVDETWNDPSPAAAARVVAVATDAAREKKSRETASQETAAARVGGKGGSAAGGGITDPNAPASEFWREAYKK